VGFLGYPQPGGGAHPPIPSEGVLGEVLGDWADRALRQAHKNHSKPAVFIAFLHLDWANPSYPRVLTLWV